MSPSPETLDPYRALVLADLRALLDAVDLSHLQPLRQHLESIEDTDTRAFDAGAVHLFAVQALTGDATRGLPAASSLTLLALSADVMRSLASNNAQPAGVLENAWGMPRALNAGDAFYALAQQSLMRLSSFGMPDQDVMKASAILRSTTLGLCEDLLMTELAEMHPPLATALALAALVGGAPAARIDELTAAEAQPDAEALNSSGMNDVDAHRLQKALDALAEERGE